MRDMVSWSFFQPGKLRVKSVRVPSLISLHVFVGDIHLKFGSWNLNLVESLDSFIKSWGFERI